MITYGLGIITVRRIENEIYESIAPSANMNISINLSKAEYEGLLAAVSKVGSIYQYADMFSTTVWNYEDLVNTIDGYFQAFIQKDMNFLVKRNMTLNINKDLLNVLTSFRFYLDFMTKNLISDFGESSELAGMFGKYCANEYDTNFSYRFIYHLRNYAQHKGLIVNSIIGGKNLDEENLGQVRHHLRIYLNRNNLLDDKKFKADLKGELINLPEKIDIMEHISNWISSLNRIHNQITREIIPAGLKDANLIKHFIDKLNYNPNDDRMTPFISVIDHSNEDDKQILNPRFVNVPIKDALKIIEYCKDKPS